MSNSARTILLDDFTSSLNDLFQCYSGEVLELTEEASPTFEPTYSASIGFGTEKIRGSVVLLTDAKSADKIWGDSTNTLSDWLGELANQVVGRFKNKVAECGVLINMGLPTAIYGKDINVEADDYQMWQTQAAGCHFATVLKLAIDEDLELQRDPNLSSAEEGSLCLF